MKRWTFLAAILIANFFLADNSFGQGHFVPAFTGNGVEHMNINVVEAKIGGVALEAGDEIAVFDGTICCGKVILIQPILFSNPGTFVSIAASKTESGMSNGFTTGNPITLKFWDSSKRKEMSGLTVSFINTSGATIVAPTYTVGASAFVKLSVAALPNQTPVSNAGIDQSVNEGIAVTLNGSGSSDSDYDALKYSWTAPAGITLSSTTAVNPTFTAPEVSVNTNYTFSLVVNDGTVNSATDLVIVTVRQINQPTTIKTMGNTSVYSLSNLTSDLRAIPLTFSETGSIQSISIYHNGGSGNVLLGVYSDQSGSPSSRLGVTSSTLVNAAEGWQTIPLTSPVSVSSGQTVWLSWVSQNSLIVRYMAGLPGRVVSPAKWTGGMPLSFGAATNGNYKYSIYCTYTTTKTLGNADVYGLFNSTSDRRAIPLTFSETGSIQSISIYHNGGTGNLLLGVYSDQSGSPSSRLGITSSTLVNAAEGWQTIPLTSPVSISSGQTVWLSWVSQNSLIVRYMAGLPGRVVSPATWTGGMPLSFGTATYGNYKYSIFCTYTPNASVQLKSADIALDIDPVEDSIEEILIYPNPTDGNVNIDFSTTPEANSWISVFDMSGRIIRKLQAESKEETIDLHGNPPGIYLIKIDQKIPKTYKLVLE